MARSKGEKPRSHSIAYAGSHELPASGPDLRLLHYNDVYHIEEGSQEPIGGAARFQTLCKYYRESDEFANQPELIELFSGDAFNPSLESSVTKGSHMVPILNAVGTKVACVGNHDLDFGVPQFERLVDRCQFPWLLANVLDPALGDDVPLGHAKKTTILTSSNGIKIGFIGLVEQEWLETINSLPPNLIFRSASATAQELIPGLRAQGAEIIIALTHQREPNDNKLAQETPSGLIDLILGGHDHYYGHQIINDTHVLRSGTDFKQLSYIEARRENHGVQNARWTFQIIRRDITSDVSSDPTMSSLVDSLTSSLKSKLEQPIGYTAAPLDARFVTVRLKESNIGNFVCDIMRHYYSAEACLMAAGTIRGDQIYPPGVLKLKDIMNCFPFEDPVVVLKVTGKALWGALENSVGKYPALEGRFPQVSNIELEFDPQQPEGSRITYVKVGGEPLEMKREYKLATRGYMGRGKDGYTSLLIRDEGGEAEEIVSEENGILISMLLRQYFMSLKVLCQWHRVEASMRRHWSGVHDELHQVHPVRDPANARKSQPQDRSRSTQQNGHINGNDRISTGTNGTEVVQSSDGKTTMEEKPRAYYHSDSGEDFSDPKPVPTEATERDRELTIMRRVIHKWWRLAGLPGHPRLCDELEEEFCVNWTKSISPRLEGRIRQKGA
ncbi:MAG: hypothetical protein M1822_005970 [Bathelium mastoideum]|nr:MAG: hypothetical protein M1822_005970 [Bathelium mastoideum]